MGIMDHLLPTPTPRLHMLTPLRPMGIGILITDRGTTPATGTVVIMGPEILWLLWTSVVSKILYAAAIELYFAQVVVVTDKGYGWSPRKGRVDTRLFWGCVANREVER